MSTNPDLATLTLGELTVRHKQVSSQIRELSAHRNSLEQAIELRQKQLKAIKRADPRELDRMLLQGKGGASTGSTSGSN